MILMPNIASRLIDTPLMIAPEKLNAILIGIGARIVEGGIVLEEGSAVVDHVAFDHGRTIAGTLSGRLGARLEREGQRPYDMVGNVAVIPVEGSLVHKGAFIGQSSGDTSYQGLQAQIVHAARDPMVRGVAFEHDSFGGEVPGAFETASMIAQLSAIKPTMSILNEHSASASYLLAAPTRQIAIPETGGAGSIGVLSIHVDRSGQLEQKGMKVTIISSGAHKVDGNPFEPLPADVKARAQARVDKQREMFAASVGQYRGRRLTKQKALDTEATFYHGSDAVAAGLADVVAPAHDAFAAFIQAVNKAA